MKVSFRKPVVRLVEEPRAILELTASELYTIHSALSMADSTFMDYRHYDPHNKNRRQYTSLLDPIKNAIAGLAKETENVTVLEQP